MLDSVKRSSVGACLLLAAISISAPLRAQDIGVAAHVGTMGLGGDVAVMVLDKLGARASLNYFPFDINFEASDIDYSFDLPSPQFLLLADFYPAGQFRLSGGLMISATNFGGTAELAESVEIGNTTYTPAQIGTLTATLATRDVSPYIGIGVGNPTAKRIGFFLDLGVAFHGNPEVSAEADGPVASLSSFQADLDEEVEEIQDDVENIIIYPVLSIGLSFALGL